MFFLIAILSFQLVQSANLAEVLTENGLTKLVDLLVQTGLDAALSGPGPFTVFAPTNDAIDKVAYSVANDKDKLTEILTYHVLNGRILSSALTNDQLATTLQGQARL